MIKDKLRKIHFLKKNYRKIKKTTETLRDKLRFKFYKVTGDKILFSHYARVNNFGDRFNKDLFAFFNIKLLYVDDYKKSEASLTGSILHMYERDYNGYVLGSGFIKETNVRLNNNWKIALIRGPLSAKQCGCSNDLTFGDPGILASVVYSKNLNKKYRLGIVPHDIDLDFVKRLRFDKKVKIINVRRSPSKVAKDIQECEFIASSSLHGLIFADSFMIPNIHIRFGDKLIGGNHKFKDYYLGMNAEHEFINFDYGLTVKEIVSNCKMRFSYSYIKNKQRELVNKFKLIIEKVLLERGFKK